MTLLEKKKQLTEKDIDNTQQLSNMPIEEQLNVLQEVKMIDYQNSLVMASLEKYNKKFEQLKKEQTELLENISNQMESFKKSNDLLNQNMKETLDNFTSSQKAGMLDMIDKANHVLDITDKGLKEKIEKFKEETDSFISNCEEGKKKIDKRYRSFFHNRKIIDFIIIIDLIIIPILAGGLAYRFFLRYDVAKWIAMWKS